MPPFSEVRRIEAAIRNKSAKELEWSLWYCRMRQAVPSARPADLKYWSGVEERVQAVLAPPVAEKIYPVKKKRATRGLGSGADASNGQESPADATPGAVRDT